MARTAEFKFVGDPKSAVKAAGAVDQAVGKTATSVEASNAKMRASAERTGAALKKMALGAGAIGVLGVGYAIKSAASFEQQLSKLGAVADATGGQMDALRKQALKAGADTAYSAKQAAVAQTELAKGGLTATQILGGGLKSALSLAAAGELELGDAAAITANSMNLFGLQGKQSIVVADALATAANATTADVSDFGLALAQGGSVAKSSGLSFTQTVVALEALAKSGIKGSDAGTSLKTSMIQLLKPTNKQADLAEHLGLSFLDASGHMKSLGDISGMLRDKLGDQTKAQRTATLATLAGADGVRTLTALYDAGPKRLEAYEKGLHKQGTAAEVAAKKQKNLSGQLEQLKGSAETLAISVGSALLPSLTRVAKGATQFVNGIQDGTGAGGKFRDAVMKIINPLKDLVKGFRDGKTWAVALVAGLAGLTGAVGAIKTITAVTKLWTAAQIALDVALNANPISLIIVGLAALAAGLVVVYTKSATFRKIVAAAFRVVRSVAADAFDVITFGIRQFLTGIGKITGAVSHLPGMGWLKGISKAALSAAGTLSKVSTAIRGVPDKKTLQLHITLSPDAKKALKALNQLGNTVGGPMGTGRLTRAEGGIVPGTGRGDIVPALLEPGEFVMRRAVVERFGPTYFANLNGGMGDRTQRYTGGGIVARANAVDRMHIPYLYGGGHSGSGLSKGGMDCSAAVSYALGVSPRVSGQFMSFGEPGPGSANDTKIFANPEHVFAVFNGRGWGTSRENPGGGPGWLSYNYRPGFTIRHLEDSDASRSAGRGDPQETNERGKIQAHLDQNLDRLDTLRDKLARVPRGKAHAGQRASLQSQIRGLVSSNRGLRSDLRSAPTEADVRARQETAGSRLFNTVTAPFRKAATKATRQEQAIGTDISDADTRYGQLERLFGQSDEDLQTVEGKTRRLGEIAALKQEKRKQLTRERKRATALKAAISKLQGLLKAAGRARDSSRGAKRAKIISRMKAYEDRLTDLRAELKTLTNETIPGTELDIGDLDKEARDVASTQPDAVDAQTLNDRLADALDIVSLQERAGLITPEQATAQRISYMQATLAQGGLSDRERLQILGDLREAAQAQTAATDELTQALRDSTQAQTEANAIASSRLGIGLREAERALTDVISGQLGYRVNTRSFTPGDGSLARL